MGCSLPAENINYTYICSWECILSPKNGFRTLYDEKMVGWSLLISKVGMTTLVNVWCSRVSPKFLLISSWRYFPSYLGPIIARRTFAAVLNGQLRKQTRKSTRSAPSHQLTPRRNQQWPGLWEDLGGMIQVKLFDVLCSIKRSVLHVRCSQHCSYQTTGARPRHGIKVICKSSIFTIQFLLVHIRTRNKMVC